MPKRKTNSRAAGPDRAIQARFWRKFLRLTRGRIPVLKALDVIVAEESHPGFRGRLAALLLAMEQGAVMSEAMAGVAPCFSRSVIELVRSAEKSGAWDEILLEIADGLDEGTFS